MVTPEEGAERARHGDEQRTVDLVQSWINEGIVASDIGRRLGYSTSWVYRFAKRHGIRMRPGKPSSTVPSAQAQAILRDYDLDKGLTLDEIGSRHGVSGERVRQIAERWGRLSRRGERTSEMFSLRDVVAEALEGATTLSQVADRTGLSVAQIKKVAEVTLGIDLAEVTEANRAAERAQMLDEQSQRLRIAIEMAGLTHRQIAEALGIAASRVTNIANGKIPGVETFRDQLARVCGVDGRWLVDGTNAPPYLKPGVTETSLMAERAAMADRLGDLFERLRDIVGIGEIADRIGMNPPQLAHLAGNRSSPRRHLAALAEALDLPESWLRSGQPAMDWATVRQRVAARFGR